MSFSWFPLVVMLTRSGFRILSIPVDEAPLFMVFVTIAVADWMVL
jgi:hypothetical protein